MKTAKDKPPQSNSLEIRIPRNYILASNFTDKNKNKGMKLFDQKIFDLVLLGLIDPTELFDVNNPSTQMQITLSVSDCLHLICAEESDKSGGNNVAMIHNSLLRHRASATAIPLIDAKTGRYEITIASWLNRVKIVGENDKDIPRAFELEINRDIAQHILADRQDMISYPAEYALKMKSRFGYEARKHFLAMGVFDKPIEISLRELAEWVDAVENLEKNRFPDFRRFVIEKIVQDINTYALDLRIRIVGYRKTKIEGSSLKTTHVTFYITKTLPDINSRIISTNSGVAEDPTTLMLRNHIREQICYDDLCSEMEDRCLLDTVVETLLAAYGSLEKDGQDFSNKFNFTPEQMKSTLDQLNRDKVTTGIQKASRKKMVQNVSLWLLQCILTAEEPKQAQDAGKKAVSKESVEKAINLVGYDYLLTIFRTMRMANGVFCDDSEDPRVQVLDEIVNAITYVLSTPNNKIKINGNEYFTAHIRQLLENQPGWVSNIREIIDRYLDARENGKIRNYKYENARRSYLLTSIINEIWNEESGQSDDAENLN